ncbi:Zinc finger X-linked protein ZXDB [Nymphon striatum]|nr:Zinc finger X-linked protein ZXDB [Nymphon striatum]
MFVQGRNNEKCGDNSNFEPSGDREEFSSHLVNDLEDASVCETNFTINNGDHKKCVDSLEIELSEENSEALQFDAMVLKNAAGASEFELGEVKEHGDLPSQILQDKHNIQFDQNNSAECESFQMQSTSAVEGLPELNDSQYIMVHTDDGEQVYAVDTSQFLQAINTNQSISIGENGVVLMNPTEEGRIVMDNYGEYVVETLPSIGNNSESNGKKKSPKKVLNQTLKCPEENCNKFFGSKQKLKAHSVVHSQERPFKCSFDSCEWSFNTISKLNRHVESHTGQKNFTCEIENCNKQYTTIYNLKAHMKHHNRPFNVCCTVCDQKFPSIRSMEIHLKEHKEAEAPYQCTAENCGKRFISSYALSSHKRKHQTPESELRCSYEGCNKLFENHSRLRQHTRQHTGERPYVCNFEGCDWAFATNSRLSRHQRKHTGNRKYVCHIENCDKRFMRKEHLDQHVISHTKERPFVCEYKGCDARFAAKASWYVHKKKMHQANSVSMYICVYNDCQKEFTDLEQAKKHYQEEHPSESNADPEVFAFISNEECETISENVLAMSTSSVDMNGGAIITLSDLDSSTKELYSATSGSTIHIVPVKCDSSELTQAVSTIDNVPSNPINSEIVHNDMNYIQTSSVPEEGKSKEAQKENHSSCARTDFVFSSDRRRSSRVPMAASTEVEYEDPNAEEALSRMCRKRTFSELDSDCVPLSMNLAPTDVVLTSGAITFRDPTTGAHFVQTQLLQDDPPCVVTDIQSDQLLPNLCSSQLLQPSELTVPLSMFSDNGDSSNKSQASQCFTGMTLSLHDFSSDTCLQNSDC